MTICPQKGLLAQGFRCADCKAYIFSSVSNFVLVLNNVAIYCMFSFSLHGFRMAISLSRELRRGQVELASLECIARARTRTRARPHRRRVERPRLLLVVEFGALRWRRHARRRVRTHAQLARNCTRAPLCLCPFCLKPKRCHWQRSARNWCCRGQWRWWRRWEQRARASGAREQRFGQRSVGRVEPPDARGRVARAPLRLLRALLLRALQLERRAARAGATHSQLGFSAASGALSGLVLISSYECLLFVSHLIT